MARTLLALLVPEADPVVASFRDQHDPSARRGLGAHITLVYPFIESELLTDAALARLRDTVADVPAPMFRLLEVRTFPAVVWLAPEPPRGIVQLAQALERTFPEQPAGGGVFPQFVPHLTVARRVPHDEDAIANEMKARMADYGPIYCWCERVALLVNEDRRWRLLREFPLLQ